MKSTRFSGGHVASIVVATCVAIILVPVVAQAGGSASRTTTGGTRNLARTTTSREVQSRSTKVTGTVKVSNFPATQAVKGTVSVGNLPATQNVAGTVNVGNLPGTQSVSGTVTADPGRPGAPYASYDEELGGTANAFAPAGKTLVMLNLSLFAGVTAGDEVYGYVHFLSGATQGFVFVHLTLAYSSGPLDWYSDNQSVQIYADPGSTISFDAFSPEGNSNVSAVEFSVAGYSIS